MILIPNHSYTSLFLLALLDVLLCTPGEEPKRPAQLATLVGGLLIRYGSQRPPCLQVIWNWKKPQAAGKGQAKTGRGRTSAPCALFLVCPAPQRPPL